MKSFKINRTYLAIIFFLIIANTFSLQAKTVYYVTATGTGDGSSWSNAASNIQPMIDKAISGDEVWVAKGTYYPTTETIARDSRSRSFVIKSGVNLYGGFAGSETNISQRALADLNADGKTDSCELVNTTILSGDIDGVADVWTKTINTDGKTWKWTISGNENNCYCIVSCSGSNIINGLSIIGGNANSSIVFAGGGICSNSIYLPSRVENCTVSYCYAGNGIYNGSYYPGGGGISCKTVSNSRVYNCYALGGGGGGISCINAVNCNVSNCSSGNGGSSSYGGGISCDEATNCIVSDCSVSGDGGGINSYKSTNNCSITNCSASNRGGGIEASNSSATNCTISNCSAGTSGGGIEAYYSSVTNCAISNCSAGTSGGGIYSSFSSLVSNCTVSNCSAGSSGGGVYANSSVTNCAISNCSAGTSGGGIYTYSSPATNCASSNNSTAGTIGSGIGGGTQSSCISPSISDAYIQPTSFIGVAITDAQKSELINANWRLKESSQCINAGTSTGVSTTILIGKDFDNNPRVLYGTIDIGAYEYTVPKIQMPVVESFDSWTDFEKSELFYRSTKLNTLNDIKWTIVNQKADFNWQTNLTSTYSQPIFTYQIDGTKTSKIYLRYDMYFQAYAGTISPLGTEKLNVEFSTDLITWSTIATYSNANGTIANQTYKHDISTLAAGKTFFIRFNANGQNSNRIEKWEIDNVVIDADGISAVEVTKEDKLLYSISGSKLTLRNIEQGSYVQLFDINGKLIDSAKANSNTLDFSLPVHGVYILKASSESGITSRKVVL